MQPVSAIQPVSIVVTVLNEAQDIPNVIASLLAQTPPAAEVVVVDGGSTDGTWEFLAATMAADPRLMAIRDETCSLKHSAGPVSRGRNVAIAAAKSDVLACADAGCSYAPDWLANLTTPLVAGNAEYSLGGTCLDPDDWTVWDVASAPYFSIKLSPTEPTKSCTARSMAFTRSLWQRIGGFPESVLVGEDTLFDMQARRAATPAFINNAKALYRPHNTFRSATHQMARYAVSDGQSRVRWARLVRNTLRCLIHLLAVFCLFWSLLPFLLVFAFESWSAFHRDDKYIVRFGPGALVARMAFSLAVPWVIAVNHMRGLFTRKSLTNRQNA